MGRSPEKNNPCLNCKGQMPYENVTMSPHIYFATVFNTIEKKIGARKTRLSISALRN